MKGPTLVGLVLQAASPASSFSRHHVHVNGAPLDSFALFPSAHLPSHQHNCMVEMGMPANLPKEPSVGQHSYSIPA